MKCLFLAAGFATRLYPLTQNFPKPLLKVGERNILDRLVDDLESTRLIDGYCVVSNARFVDHFHEWVKTRPENIAVVNDGTTTNETRLGAVRDLALGIESLKIDDDLLVLAGDNLLDFSLKGFLEYAREKGTSCAMRYNEPDVEKLKRCGVMQIDAQDRVVSMEEKPPMPQSHWCAPPFYYYRREDLPLVATALNQGCGVDAPGSFLAWLAAHVPVHAYLMPGKRFDVGTLESYNRIQEMFQRRDA